MSRWITLIALGSLLGCGARAPTIDQQRAVIEQRAPTPKNQAELGWWRYLTGDSEGARAAFKEAPDEPLAALGLARLASDALDHRAAMTAAIQATRGTGLVGLVAQSWVRALAKELPDGKALATAANPDGGALTDPRHTVRISFLPFLDLPRIRLRGPVIDDDRVQALGKWWALKDHAPDPDPDSLVLTVWPLRPETVDLSLTVDGPVVAWRDGRVVVATPLDRFSARTVRFRAPGTGPLIVVWAAGRTPRVRYAANPPVDPTRRAGPKAGAHWVDRYLAVTLAIADADTDSLTAWLDGAPPTPAFAVLRAQAAPLDPGRPARASRDTARSAWNAALPQAPALAHRALGRLDWRAKDLKKARAHLEAAREIAQDDAGVYRSLLRVHLSAERFEHAKTALGEIERILGDPCRAITDRLALIDQQDVDDPPDLSAQLVRCGRGLVAAERALNRLRPTEALDLLDNLPEHQREGPRGQKLRAQALIGLGQTEAAIAALEGDDEHQLLRADLQVGHGSGADLAPITAAVQAPPTKNEALDLLATWPEWSAFADLSLDTEAAIAAFREQAPQPGPAVRVLDHSALIYFANGRRLRWVHEILAIRSRDAAEVYGELSLPADVRILQLYTRKDDGRQLDAEESPEKETISLRDLESGDFIVAVYIEPGDNGYLYNSGFLSPRIYFRSTEMPTFHHRFEVYGPDEIPLDLQLLNGAQTPETVTLGAQAGLRFDLHREKLFLPEPGSVPDAMVLPSARVGHGVDLAADLDYLRDRAAGRRRRTPSFDAWVKMSAGGGTLRVRLKRLARAVREAIDDELGVIEEDAPRALATGHGSRALVLSAALESLKIPHELWVTRPKVHAPAGPFLTVADFPYPLIRVTDGPLWLDPGPERADLGFFPSTLVGGDGVIVWPTQRPVGPHALPTERAVGDRRDVELIAHWGDDGVLRGTVVDRLIGQESIVIGHHLSRLEAKDRPRLMERLLVTALGATKVIALDDVTQQDPDGPLELRYTFEATPGDTLQIGAFPNGPGRTYASLAERKTPLSITLPTHQTVRIKISSDRDFAVKARPGTYDQGAHHFAMAVDSDEDSIEISARIDVAGGVIAPADYPAFAAWARKVDPAERITLTIKK